MKLKFREIFEKLSFKGILIGTLIDHCSTVAFISIVFLGALLKNGSLSPKEVEGILSSEYRYSITQLVGGLAASFLGGYVAARIAKRAELVNGAVTASIFLVTGFILSFRSSSSMPAWFDWVGQPMSVISGIAGGHLAAKQNRRKIQVGGLKPRWPPILLAVMSIIILIAVLVGFAVKQRCEIANAKTGCAGLK